MNFYKWTTDYELYKQTAQNKKDVKSYDRFVYQRKAELETARTPTHRLFVEDSWRKIGFPYYNVHPNLCERLCKVDMTKIPSSMLKMPHDLETVNIRFATKHEQFVMEEGVHTDYVAQITNTSGFAPSGSFVHSVLMHKLNDIALFILDFDVYTKLRQPVYCMFGVGMEENLSLEESIDQSISKDRTPSHVNVIKNVLKLCVSIGFLSDNPTICEPDILSKDRAEFNSANEDRREFIVNRSRRRGKYGYNIGTDLMFLGERSSIKRKPSKGSSEYELDYAHIRGGHPHLVRYGEGKKLVKMRWYVPTTVRPDKPFKV